MEPDNRYRITRGTAFVAVLCAALMLGVPSFLNDGGNVSPVGEAAAADESRLFIVGGPELTVSTLSPFVATMSDEIIAIWYCASTLLTYDLDLNIDGDLAEWWTVSDDGMTWTFKIVENAYFYDRNEPDGGDHQLTVEDIIYTYWAVQNYRSNLHFCFPGEIDGSENTIKSMTPEGPYKLTIELGVPFAPFVGSIAGVPILPKYYWEPNEVNGDPTKFKQAMPIGAGPFYYDLSGTPTTGEFPLVRNPKWHHEANRGWQIHVEQLTFKGYTEPSTAWLALKQGEIDCMMGVQPSTYLTELPGLAEDGIKGFAQSTGFVYEFNLNQLTPEMRDELGWNSGSNNPILLDMDVKKALAKCINEEAFIVEVLDGLGTYADSLIPDVNPWYHRYDGPELASFEPAQAREDLMAAGWKYDAAGNPADVDECPLYGYFGDPVSLEPLSFEFITLSDVPEWEIGANLIVNWTKVAGIELNLDILPPSQMNSRWYDGDYDTWLWDWVFTPLSDPSSDVLSVLTTMEIGSWSDVYMSDPYFDSLYNESLRAMDVELRTAIVNEMQDVAYEDFSCQCIAYRKELYAVSNERWTGYGDWEEDFMLMPDQCFPYLWMMISPFGNEWTDPPRPNLAPEITSISEDPVGFVNEPIPFTGGATDALGTDLVYKWWWGDGTSTDWLSDPSEDHTYTTDGYYTVYFAVKEDSNTLDYYSNWTSVTAKVIDASNTVPHSLDIDFSPLNPDTGDIVTFSGTAVDDQDDPLNYSWSFGDVYTARGPIVTHQFATAGTYTVTMSVDDDRVGTDPRPVQTSILIAVGGNSPPTVDVPDFPDVWKDDPYDFSVTASDPDSDPMTYTWVWGDGDTSVTDTDTATHTYGLQTTYTLEVFVDDGTGVPTHNVSDTGLVTVMSQDNIAPVVVSFEPTKTDPYTGEEISFTGVASDGDGDALTLTFAFGDGTYEVFNSGATAPDTEVTFTATHTYTSATAVTARLYVWDNLANTSSNAVSITPVANAEPVVPALADRDELVNTTVTFTVDPYDPDGDEMSVCWEFGDGSAMENGLTVTHMYTVPGDDIVFRVYVDDGHGHNVTKAAVMTILAEGTNIAPVIEALEDKTALVFEVVEFAATATDANDDVLVYTWDFGDDSDLVVGQTVEHAYEAVDEYTFTVYVDDGGFNETSSATITVNASEPPVANAGVDQTVEAGDDVSFDGSDSTDDVDVVNYTWAFTYSGSAMTLYGVSPEHTFEVAGEYNVTLTVKDAENQTGTDYVLITVEETDDGKSWIDTYGLPLGIIVALIVAAMVAVLVMKGRKGGKAPTSMEEVPAGEPEVHSEGLRS